jgi:heme oxygenase (biliverdin-IX-beta and delta-forming)
MNWRIKSCRCRWIASLLAITSRISSFFANGSNRFARGCSSSATVRRHASLGVRQRSIVSAANGAPLREWHAGGRSAAYRWGVCYVIEGSQLGGVVLYERLKERLAPHPLGYLALGRDASGKRWPAFVQAMCAGLHTQAMIDEASRGASDAFRHLIDLVPRPALACGTSDD